MNNIFIFYLITMNALGFVLMYIDKIKAKKHKWRVKENTLLTIAILGGSLGSLISMYTFRHKTKHTKFTLGIPLILIIQIIFLYYTTYKI